MEVLLKCIRCPNEIPVGRYNAGYTTCLLCGGKQADTVKHTVVPMHKSNYVVITKRSDLVGINSKGGLVK